MDNKYTKELYHHGVLGMKWGIRRYQPYPKGHKGGKEIGEAVKKSPSRKEASIGTKTEGERKSNINGIKGNIKKAAKIAAIGSLIAVGAAAASAAAPATAVAIRDISYDLHSRKGPYGPTPIDKVHIIPEKALKTGVKEASKKGEAIIEDAIMKKQEPNNNHKNSSSRKRVIKTTLDRYDSNAAGLRRGLKKGNPETLSNMQNVQRFLNEYDAFNKRIGRGKASYTKAKRKFSSGRHNGSKRGAYRTWYTDYMRGVRNTRKVL